MAASTNGVSDSESARLKRLNPTSAVLFPPSRVESTRMKMSAFRPFILIRLLKVITGTDTPLLSLTVPMVGCPGADRPPSSPVSRESPMLFSVCPTRENL